MTMTNREHLLMKLSAMSNTDLADYLDGAISDDISQVICETCQKTHGGNCLMDIMGLDHCPKTISAWLAEEAC